MSSIPDPLDNVYGEYSLRLGNRHLFKNVELTISETFIGIWAEEHPRSITPGQKVMISSCAFTWLYLAAVLKAHT